MSKRKNSDDLKYLKEKLKKLEREIYSSRRKRVRVMRIASSSSSSPSPEPSPSRRPVRRSEPKGHPKTLAFVSHAGMGGTTEALRFGVPMIAMPFFGDQPSNAAAIEECGLGIQLKYKDLSKDNLIAALKKVLDPAYLVVFGMTIEPHRPVQLIHSERIARLKMRPHFITTILLLSTNNVSLLNILGILSFHGESHFLVFGVFLKELANRGHNVTLISHFREKDPPKNYKNISLAGSISAIEGSFKAIENSYYNLIKISFNMMSIGIKNCEVMLADKEVQNLIKSKQKFDVVVVEQFNSDCALGVAYKIGAPVVGITSFALMPHHFQRLGIPNNPSYVSFHFAGGGTKPSFIQRIERFFFIFYFKYLYYYGQRRAQRILEKYFDDIPPLDELAQEVKFILVYNHFILSGSKLLPANVIEVGGYHVKEAKPLTGELKHFVDEAEHGVVYISFGSIINSATLPAEKVQAILEAIKEFPQRFIWKWECDSLKMKSKLYISKWLPQTDILGHPKTLAFASHAGMGSTTEALHFGVPMIATPFFGDQPYNAAAVEDSGFGIQLQYKDLTKENLVAALKKVLDPDFRRRAQEVSRAWHDRPMSPLDTAVFWTEFAAKHPNFTLRTAAADVPMYQYLYLDVTAAILVVLGIFSYLLKTCCSRNTNGTKVYKNIVKFKRQ